MTVSITAVGAEEEKLHAACATLLAREGDGSKADAEGSAGADATAPYKVERALRVKLLEPPSARVQLEVPTLAFGDVSHLFKGLTSLLGPPPKRASKAATAVEAEHTKRADSTIPFTTGNYGIETTSHVEWLYVVLWSCRLLPTSWRSRAAA